MPGHPSSQQQYRNGQQQLRAEQAEYFDEFLNLSPSGDTPIQTQFPSSFAQYNSGRSQYAQVHPYQHILADQNSDFIPGSSSNQTLLQPVPLSQPQLKSDRQQLHFQSQTTMNQQMPVYQQASYEDIQPQAIYSSNFEGSVSHTPPVIIETPPQESDNLTSASSGFYSQHVTVVQQQQQQQQYMVPTPSTQQSQQEYQYESQPDQYLNIGFQNSFANSNINIPNSPYSSVTELSSVANSPYLQPNFADDQAFVGSPSNLSDTGFLSIGQGLDNVDLSDVASEVSFHDLLGDEGIVDEADGNEADRQINGVFQRLTQDNLMINDERISKQQLSHATSPVTICIEVPEEFNFEKKHKVESLFSNSNKSSRTNSRHNSQSSQHLKSGSLKATLSHEGSVYSSPGVFEEEEDDDDDQDDEDYRDKNSFLLPIDPDHSHSNMRQSRQKQRSLSNSNSRTRNSSRSRSISANRSREGNNGSASSKDNREKILELASPQQTPKRTQKHPSIYACHLCEKRFTRPYNLKSHLRTHTDERPFVCSICGKAFARQHDRKRHEDLHSGHKKFQCLGMLRDGVTQWGCGKKFARTDALGRHFKTEAGKLCIKPLLDENEAEMHKKEEGEGADQNGKKLVVPSLRITDDDGVPEQVYTRFLIPGDE